MTAGSALGDRLRAVEVPDEEAARERAAAVARAAFAGRTPVALQYQSAAEIAELDRQIKARAPQIKAELERRQAKEAAEFSEAHKPLPKISVSIPAEASGVEPGASEIKFTVAKGKAKGVTQAWRKQFHDAGWKEDVAVMEAMAGALSLSKEKTSLTIHYTDTGFTPAEVSISAMGAELEPAPNE